MRHMYLNLVLLLALTENILMRTVCRPGEKRSGKQCVDDDECVSQPSICGRNATCFNTIGSYYCQCHEGFTPPSPHNFTEVDRIECQDINECLVGIADCGPNTTCVNTEGGYYCTCATGYISSNGKDIFNSGQGVQCIDRDECSDPSFCGKHASCHNTAGGFYCICEAGFRLKSGRTNFTDTSELCEILLLALTENILMRTVCRPGEIRSGKQCVDDDECVSQPSICGRNATCFNTNGSYYCQCHEGFTPPSPHNFTEVDRIECQDINECVVGSDDCGPNTTCVNTEGGYYCTCATGYISSNGKDIFNSGQGVQCIDRDECKDPSFCGKHASCHNTAGGFYCICEAGFRLKSGGTNFTDTSELCEKLKCDRFLSEKDTSQTSPELTKLVSLMTDSCLIMNQSESVNNNTQAHGEKLLKGFLSDLDDLNHGGFSGDNDMISALFRIVVNILKLIGHLLSASRTRKISAKAEVELLVKRGNSPPEGDFRMNISGAQLTSHWDTATGNTFHGFTTAALLSYKGLDESLNCCFDHLETTQKQTYKINSKVVTATFINTETTNLNKPIKLTFSHLKKKNEKHMCVFWDPELDGGAWSTLGCSTVSSRADQTVCSCNKLGSFAVLTVLCDTGVCRPTLNFCTLDSKP